MTSFHAHKNKKTSLIVIGGSINFCNFTAEEKAVTGQGFEIDKGTFHQSAAVWNEDAILIEIETPPDKLDLVRGTDNYGRERMGYEGKKQMITEGLSQYDYFYVSEHEKYYSVGGTNFSFALHHVTDKNSFDELIKSADKSFFQICNSPKVNNVDESCHLTDYVFTSSDLDKFSKPKIDYDDVDILELRMENDNGV